MYMIYLLAESTNETFDLEIDWLNRICELKANGYEEGVSFLAWKEEK